jgi:hypothetical protein
VVFSVVHLGANRGDDLMAKLSKALITIIAQHNVWLYELLFPHVPKQLFERVALHSHAGFHRGGGERELNPQPLPPVAIATLSGHAMGRRLADLALGINAQGGDGFSVLAREIEGWCGTGPRKFKWPKGWPFPPPEPDPHPNWDLGSGGPPPTPWLDRQILLGGAIALMQTAAGFPDGDLQEGFAKQADVLIDTAMSIQG